MRKALSILLMCLLPGCAITPSQVAEDVCMFNFFTGGFAIQPHALIFNALACTVGVRAIAAAEEEDEEECDEDDEDCEEEDEE